MSNQNFKLKKERRRSVLCPDIEEVWGEKPIITKGSSSMKIVSDEEAFEVDQAQ